MKIKDYENEVLEYFQKLSFSIEKIPESNEKTPDFLISGSEKILIELKAKFDAKELRDEQENVLTSGEVFQHGELTGYTNKVAKVISDGKSQLKRRLSGIHAAWHFWYAVGFGGESVLRKVGLCGIHPLTQR